MMKKFCLTFCMVMIAVLAFAGGIKVNKGKATYMKNEGKMFVVFDWEDARWNNEMPVKEQWNEEYDAYVENGEVICTYKVDEFKGGRDFSIFDSYKEAMQDLGSKLAKTK